MYQKNRDIKRTVFQGVVWWPVDPQSLPPWGWCEECGAEVYRWGKRLCRRCEEELRIEN